MQGNARKSTHWKWVWRWVRRALILLVAALLGALTLLVAVLNIDKTRNVIRERINRSMSDAFQGTLLIERIGHVGLFSVGGIDGRVLDARRRTVLGFQGLSVRSYWPAIVRDLILGRPLSVVLAPVTLDHARIELIDDGSGTPTLATAFNPRETTSSTSDQRPLTIALERVHIKHIWAYGGVSSLRGVDMELSNVEASFRSGEPGLFGEIAKVRLLARSLPFALDPSGVLRARIAMPNRPTQSGKPGAGRDEFVDPNLQGSVDFEGSLGDSPVVLRANSSGSDIDVSVQLPAVSPETWRKLLPRSNVAELTTVDVRARGELPNLHVEALATQLATRLEISADARIGTETGVSVVMTASNVDLATWLAGAPRSNLSLSARATVTSVTSGGLGGDFLLTVPAGEMDSWPTPVLTCSGTISSETSAAVVAGAIDVRELGAPTHGSFRLRSAGDGNTKLHAELATQLSQPPRLASMLGVRTSGVIELAADADLTSRQIVAEATIRLGQSSKRADWQLGALQIRFGARGDLDSPRLTVRANAEQLRLGERVIPRVRLSINGTRELMAVDAEASSNQGQQLRLATRASAIQGIVLDHFRATLSDQEGTIAIQAERVRQKDGQTHVEDLRVRGIGELASSIFVGTKRFDARLTAHDIDLGRIARVCGIRPVIAGSLDLEGNLGGTLQDLEGRLNGHARGLSVSNVHGGRIDIDLDFADRRLNGTIVGTLQASRVEARFRELEVPAGRVGAHWLRDARGEVAADAKIGLSQLTPILRQFGAPLERLDGDLTLSLLAKRDPSDLSNPSLYLEVKSNRLGAVEQRDEKTAVRDPARARATKPRTLEGIDFDVRIDLDPRERELRAAIGLHDRVGLLLSAVGQSGLPNWSSNWREELQNLPARLSVLVPERAVEKLPATIKPSAMRGRIAVALDASGTMRAPRLRGQFSLRKFQPREGKNYFDADVELGYEPSGGSIRGNARAMRGGSATVSSDWKGDLLGQLRDPVAAGYFELGADVDFDKVPLGLVPMLFERQIRGPLSGALKLRGLGRNAELTAKFDGSGLIVSRVHMPRLDLALKADDSALFAMMNVVQDTGRAQVEVRTGSQWGARLVPEIDPRAHVDFRASRFELEVLSPLVAAYLNTLEGKLDANLSAQLDPEKPTIQGTAALDDGVMQLPQIGQRFSDVKAKVVVGGDEVRVESIQARGVAGRLTGDARARLQGLRLQSVDARLAIAEREKLPITYEGVEIGDAWGEANVNYARTDGDTEIRVTVPRFSLTMPESAQRDVQDLEPAEDIRIGTHRSDGQFVAIPLQPFDSADSDEQEPSLTRVRVRLGDSVWIERGSQVRVQIAGNLAIESGAEQRIDGRIEVRGGRLDVSGKRFEIERGLISFDQTTPPNPTVTATARYDSPAGYVVYADYAGTAKDGKLRLHSEPVLTQDEILSLLLFGSPEGSFATSGSGGTTGGLGSSGSDRSSPGNSATAADGQSSGTGSSTAGAAVSIAGGTATKGLNKALSDFTSLDVSTRIDTSTGSARPELVMQLTPRLTTRITRAIGEPAPGQSLDRTFLTLELRLKRAWSASAVVGDHGASRFDLIWRKRY